MCNFFNWLYLVRLFDDIWRRGDQKWHPAAYQVFPPIWNIDISNICKYTVTSQFWHIGYITKIAKFQNEETIIIAWNIIVLYKQQTFFVLGIRKNNRFWININLACKIYIDCVRACYLNTNWQYLWSLYFLLYSFDH